MPTIQPIKTLLLVVFGVFYLSANAQKVSGYLYDSEGIVSNFKIKNQNQGFYTETNEKGFFEISAKVGDSILFNSIAYNRYTFVVKETDFNKNVVVELNFNTLDEVKINSGKSFKTDPDQLDEELNAGIQYSIKNNPLDYRPSNGNLLEIPRLIIGLLSKKNGKTKVTAEKETVLKPQDYYQLFETDNLFNAEFLSADLNIPEHQHYLFIDYLATKNYTSAVLQENRKLDFIDILHRAAKEFHEQRISEENK
ncbi:hypothetical protein [Zunongwangia endophytica]|uniref:CarboxypepD_reg-like domain-containing protein n=1 Tax=Zunongwangia endophytica TaxID=1808945 RepID=A0ABV8H718_9FLAO|nr:hypothetical protein [Zunongwangia endophytica]MDN3593889.1 hypothetical protein [Zunongwangia endophytica]